MPDTGGHAALVRLIGINSLTRDPSGPLRRSARRHRLTAVTVGAAVVLALSGCASSGSEVSVDASRPTSVRPAAPGSDTQTVRYRGLEFEVPADWPVYDLEADPTRCVRFDVHAVYLGHPGADQRCPAHLIGRTETVLVEPGAAPPGAAAPREINGLSVNVDPAADVTHDLVAAVPGAGVIATITFPESDARAQEILRSFAAPNK